jgi:isopenicillin N synthase-like dioxygenase
VINIGDLMARWTNDCWVSTIHRVANPARERRRGSRRQSIAFFHQPNYDAEIRCIESCLGPERPAKYAPITSGDYLMMTPMQTMKMAKDVVPAGEERA